MDEDGVKQVLKRWRTSRVDVDLRNKPCLEQMMTIVEEGNLLDTNDVSKKRELLLSSQSLNNENEFECSCNDLERLIGSVDNNWEQSLRHQYCCDI